MVRKTKFRERSARAGVVAFAGFLGLSGLALVTGSPVGQPGLSSAGVASSLDLPDHYSGTDFAYFSPAPDGPTAGPAQPAEQLVRLSRASSRSALTDKTGKQASITTGQGRQENVRAINLASLVEKAVKERSKNGWVKPLTSYRLTALFGQCSALWSRCHTGLDFAAPSGTPLVAMANGVITSTGYAGAYGNRTILTLDDGTQLWYCHQSTITAERGTRVSGGQTIGYVGATGNVTGPHLHLEVRPGGGDAVDPAKAMDFNGIAP